MDKQIIEKMAKDLAKISGEYLQNCADSCDDCPYGNCRGKFALDLYNAGYRKIPEGSVVLTKEEYEKLKRFEHQCFAMGAEIEESCQNGYLDGYERGEERVRKETAEKFAERLVEKAFIEFTDCDYDRLCFLVGEIAKEITEGV